MRTVLLFLLLLTISGNAFAQLPEMVIQSWHNTPTGMASEVDLIVSSDRKYAVTYDGAGDFRLWDLQTKRLIRNMSLSLQGILMFCMRLPYWSSPALSFDNKHLLTQAEPPFHGFYLWDTDNGRIVHRVTHNIRGDSMHYHLAAFSDVPNTLLLHGLNTVTGLSEVSYRDFVRHTDRSFTYERPLKIGRKMLGFNNAEWVATRITAFRDKVAIGTTDGCIYIFNTARLKEGSVAMLQPQRQFVLDSNIVEHLCFSKDGGLLTAGTKAGAKVWDVNSGKLIQHYEYPFYDITQWGRSYDGKMSDSCSCIVTRESKNSIATIKMTEPLTRKIIRTASGENPDVIERMPSFSALERRYLSAALDLEISLEGNNLSGKTWTKDFIVDSAASWKFRTDALYKVTNAVLDPTNNELIVGMTFNNALIFNLGTGKAEQLRKFVYTPDTAYRGYFDNGNRNEYGFENNLYLSANKQYLLTFDADVPIWHTPKAMVWDRQSGNVLTTLHDLEENSGGYIKASLSKTADGKKWLKHFLTNQPYIAHVEYIQGEDRGKGNLTPITITDNKTGKIVRTVYPYEEENLTNDFAKLSSHKLHTPPGRNHFYVGMQDGSVLMYNFITGKLIRAFNRRTLEETTGLITVDYNPVQVIQEDATGKYLYVARENRIRQSHLIQYEVATGDVVKAYGPHVGNIQSLCIHPKTGMLITTSLDGRTRFWHPNGELRATMLLKGPDYVLFSPEGYYMSSKRGTVMTHYVREKKVYLFEQFDLKYNRPDKVLSAIGIASSEVIGNYRKAYEKRLEKSGIAAKQVEEEFMLNAPVVRIGNTPGRKVVSRMLPLKVHCSDAGKTISRINVSINGVPLQGVPGTDLASASSSDISKELQLELVSGVNTIEVSAINSQGIESLRESFEVEFVNPVPKRVLHLITIGVSKYQLPVMNLDYASRDADDVSALFKQYTQGFAEIREYKFRDKEALASRLIGLRKTLNNVSVDDRVMVFYAGHGFFDDKLNYYLATYDTDFSNPARQGLAFASLEKILSEVPAREKIMLLDACHSDEIDSAEIAINSRKKTEHGAPRFRSVGGKTIRNRKGGLENSFELMKESFSDVHRRSGASIIAAARGGEYAIETSQLGNGVFTFCLLQALKGEECDRNGDKKITLSELQMFLNYKVPSLTGGKQRPISRTENLVNDFVIVVK